MTNARTATKTRIVGKPVPPLVPPDGDVQVLLIGEAPGPRGADKSGVPFFGDAAGKHLYQVLRSLGAIDLPSHIDTLPWDGATFAKASIVPIAIRVALGNAFDRCPTDDGIKFRTPTKRELEGADNVHRLRADIEAMQRRGLRGVVTMGRVATLTLDTVCAAPAFAHLKRQAVPHPSAQGLLSMAPNRGRGARMSDLQNEWVERCRNAVVNAGFVLPSLPERAHENG